MPPMRGMVLLLMRRLLGLSTAPSLQAILRARGVVASATTNAVAKSDAKGIHHLTKRAAFRLTTRSSRGAQTNQYDLI